MKQEIVPEVTFKKHSQYPADDLQNPLDDENSISQTSDQKIISRNNAWKEWGKKMQMLREIHAEPEFQQQIYQLRQKQFDDPNDYI